MRIAYFHYGIYKGGDSNGWYRTFALARGLVELGHEVFLFTTDSRSKYGKKVEKTEAGVNVIVVGEILPSRFQRGGFSLMSVIERIRALNKLGPFDLCIADNVHRPSCLIPCLYQKFFCKTLVITEWWELFGKGGIFSDLGFRRKMTVGLYDVLFEKITRKVCDGLVPISTYLQKEALGMGFPRDAIKVVHAGTLDDVCERPIERSRIVNEPLKIGLIGFNEEELKNNYQLFSTVERLRGFGVNIKIVCSGNKDLKKIVPRKFADFVDIIGWVERDEFIRVFDSCDMLSLIQIDSIRNRARFPNKFGDYLSFKGTIITNGIGDLKFYTEKYPDKVIFVEDEKDIEECITTQINKPPVFTSRIHCAENTWKIRAGEIENLCKQIGI